MQNYWMPYHISHWANTTWFFLIWPNSHKAMQKCQKEMMAVYEQRDDAHAETMCFLP